eukprot:1159538-Pelagomonas_calceolata.AAC.3
MVVGPSVSIAGRSLGCIPVSRGVLLGSTKAAAKEVQQPKKCALGQHEHRIPNGESCWAAQRQQPKKCALGQHEHRIPNGECCWAADITGFRMRSPVGQQENNNIPEEGGTLACARVCAGMEPALSRLLLVKLCQVCAGVPGYGACFEQARSCEAVKERGVAAPKFI